MIKYGQHTKDAKLLSFPSPVVPVKINGKGISCVIRIPERETFRIKEIFQDGEYSVMNHRNHNGPLTIVDVGANVGIFTIYAKFLYPNSVVHCFEPSPNCLALLRDNVASIQGIHVHSIGLSNGERQALLNIHRQNTGQNSVRFKGQEYSDAVTVRLGDTGAEFDRLMLVDIDILKIDTEGCEVEILESLTARRLSKVSYVLIEYHSEEDRRRIDNLLTEFSVFGSRATVLNLGVVKYVNKRLISEVA